MIYVLISVPFRQDGRKCPCLCFPPSTEAKSISLGRADFYPTMELQSESGFHRHNSCPVAHWAMIIVCGWLFFVSSMPHREEKPSVRTVHGSSCSDTIIHPFSLKVLDIFQVVLAGSLKKSHFFHFSLLPPTQDSYFLEMKQVASRPHIASARLVSYTLNHLSVTYSTKTLKALDT